jgi:hypothetical protein
MKENTKKGNGRNLGVERMTQFFLWLRISFSLGFLLVHSTLNQDFSKAAFFWGLFVCFFPLVLGWMS